MPKRDFYLAAYDVSNPRRLIAAPVRGYTTGGQKSVHEVFLTRGERFELLHDMALLLELAGAGAATRLLSARASRQVGIMLDLTAGLVWGMFWRMDGNSVTR